MKSLISELRHHSSLGLKVIALVFQSSPSQATIFFASNIAKSLYPAASFYLTKLGIDAIVLAAATPSPANIRSVVIVAAAAFLLANARNIIDAITRHSYNVLKDEFGKYAIFRVADQTSNLDLAHFENPKFHDQLEKVNREIYGRPFNTLDSVVEIVANLTQIISLLALLWRFSWFVPLTLLAISIPRLIFRLKYSYYTYAITDRRSPQNRTVNILINYLTSRQYVAEIKIFELKNYLLGRFTKIYDEFLSENRHLSHKTTLRSTLLDFLDALASFALFLYVVFQAIASRVTIGDVSLFLNSSGRFQQSLGNLFHHIAKFYEGTLFLHHYFDFISLKPTIVDPSSPSHLDLTQPIKVEFRHVWFAYEPGKPVLKDISFTLADAKNLALVGENGAGKTTLIKLLLRLYDATQGEILINGKDIKSFPLATIHEAMGVIFQDFKAYELSVRENIAFGDIKKINNIGALKKAARLSGANEFVDRFPEKYKALLGRAFENSHELSGGQWQKIALARAFLRDSAKLLIMDEPTASLDPKSEFEVFKNLLSQTKDKSVILISHRFSTVRLADQIIVINKGEIIEKGTHEDLIAKSGHYAKLYNLQAKWYK